MRKLNWVAGTLAMVCASTSFPSIAAEKTLLVSSWASPNHGINKVVW